MVKAKPVEKRQINDFVGRWHMARRIESGPVEPAGPVGQAGLFDGMARFTPCEGGLAYEEVGELHLPDHAAKHAKRKYIWRQSGANGIDVVFEDGSDFHHIDLTSPVTTAWYDCLPDFYEVSYNFSHWPEWRAIWRVTGPGKAYTLITDYTKAGSDANRLA